jgi:diacylglycerol kinase family enzyme
LAILPLGTANNTARSLGLAGSPKDIIGAFAKARTQRFDLGLACGPWGQRVFVEAVGLGPLTEAMSRIDAVGIERSDGVRIGRDMFRRMLSEASPIRFNLSVDGRPLSEDMLLVEILNIPIAGPGLAFAPAGNFGDGLFDSLCRARAARRHARLAWRSSS